MRRTLILAALAVVSVAFFAMAATTDTVEKALLFAVLGAVVPAAGVGVMALVRQASWTRMGRRLGLHPMQHGVYPDLAGRYEGKKLLVARRQDIYGPGRRESTLVRLEGSPEIRLPGLVVDARTIKQILEPLREAS